MSKKLPEKPATSQVNMRLRDDTVNRLKIAAAAELRSMADQADIFLVQALEIWEQSRKRTRI